MASERAVQNGCKIQDRGAGGRCAAGGACAAGQSHCSSSAMISYTRCGGGSSRRQGPRRHAARGRETLRHDGVGREGGRRRDAAEVERRRRVALRRDLSAASRSTRAPPGTSRAGHHTSRAARARTGSSRASAWRWSSASSAASSAASARAPAGGTSPGCPFLSASRSTQLFALGSGDAPRLVHDFVSPSQMCSRMVLSVTRRARRHIACDSAAPAGDRGSTGGGVALRKDRNFHGRQRN